MITSLIRINKFFVTDFTIKKLKKSNVSTVRWSFSSLEVKKKKKNKHVLLYNCEKAHEILTKTLKYTVNTSKTFVST